MGAIEVYFGSSQSFSTSQSRKGNISVREERAGKDREDREGSGGKSPQGVFLIAFV